jgi:hypothetical protein
LEKNHFTKEQFEAFAALQLKITEKERYFSYYIRKEISMTFDAMTTVRLASIHKPQIEGKFTATPGGQTNIFYGCVD